MRGLYGVCLVGFIRLCERIGTKRESSTNENHRAVHVVTKENPPDRIPMSVKEVIHDVCMQCRHQKSLNQISRKSIVDDEYFDRRL